MDEIILEGVDWFGIASMIVVSLLLLGLFTFVWQVIRSFFPEPYYQYQSPLPSDWQVAPVPQEDPMASRIKRAVGYCTQTECEDYVKGVFLLNHGDTFWCPRCKQVGFIEKEYGTSTGNFGIYKEVRVEYNYDAVQKRYRELAIVRDESLWGKCDVYHLQSPLIKTEKRALKVAEATLANLNMQDRPLEAGEIPRTHELILSFDTPKEMFAEELGKLQVRLENNAWSRARTLKKERPRASIADIGM